MKRFRPHSLISATAAALLAGVIAAFAANTTFFTSIGDQVFPFSAPDTNPAAPGTIDNMTIGATTPAAATVTNLTASGTVSGAGFTNRLAAPGAIGGTTPAAGTFTTLTFNSQLVSGEGLPTIGSGNCGAGSNGSIAAGSTNQAGQVQIGATATTTCQISFSVTLGAAPAACVLFPANATAAATGTTVARVSAIATASFTITGSALANSNYYWICI